MVDAFTRGFAVYFYSKCLHVRGLAVRSGIGGKDLVSKRGGGGG